MGVLKELSKEILKDLYFIELVNHLELLNFYRTFSIVSTDQLSEKEYFDILRFAELLSYSDSSMEKNMAYKVVALMYDFYNDDYHYLSFANSILVRLGNFPAIQYLFDEEKEYFRDNDIEMEKIIKKVYQKDPHGELVFTDPQYTIYEKLKLNNHFSFSGPTSLGKSFIMEAFIKMLIAENRSNDNIVILVPTRALINQVSQKLRIEIKQLELNESVSKYRILTHPIIPRKLIKEDSRFVFVFTPERLISYLSDEENPKIDFMFIDEAHKIVAPNDSRGPLFYHSIMQAERKSVKLYFASPNVPNSDVFLRLFEKSTDESLRITESPVAQNRYFMDLLTDEMIIFSDVGDEKKIHFEGDRRLNDWMKCIGRGHQNIVYCNAISKTIEYATSFSDSLPIKKNVRIDRLIGLIEKHIHKEYYLIDCLEKGVGFHFGRLPQRIRLELEKLFSDRVLDYLFCTSTLLEGVNLPAKNIFILSNAIGLTKFKDIDFWNLAGRAGRLTKDLSGNIICIKDREGRNHWDKPNKSLDIVRNKEVKSVKPIIMSGVKSFYKNIAKSLENKQFTNKSASTTSKDIWNQYANIVLVQNIKGEQSLLNSKFVTNEISAKMILKYRVKNISIPDYILSSYTMIKAKYQNNIWVNDELSSIVFPESVESTECLNMLNLHYMLYNWTEEESGGRYPLVKNKNKLKYLAVLMNQWMSSQPLNQIIVNIIKFHRERGIYYHQQEKLYFSGKEKNIINLIINELMSDIETNLRFKIRNYFMNYHMILVEKYGKENAGPNWGEFIEYGTNNFRVIELQNYGFPRYFATYLLNKHKNELYFEGGTLIKIDIDSIKESIDYNEFDEKEVEEIMEMIDF